MLQKEGESVTEGGCGCDSKSTYGVPPSLYDCCQIFS